MGRSRRGRRAVCPDGGLIPSCARWRCRIAPAGGLVETARGEVGSNEGEYSRFSAQGDGENTPRGRHGWGRIGREECEGTGGRAGALSGPAAVGRAGEGRGRQSRVPAIGVSGGGREGVARQGGKSVAGESCGGRGAVRENYEVRRGWLVRTACGCIEAGCPMVHHEGRIAAARHGWETAEHSSRDAVAGGKRIRAAWGLLPEGFGSEAAAETGGSSAA